MGDKVEARRAAIESGIHINMLDLLHLLHLLLYLQKVNKFICEQEKGLLYAI